MSRDPLVLGQHVAGPAAQHRVVDGPLVARAGQPQWADVGLGRLAPAAGRRTRSRPTCGGRRSAPPPPSTGRRTGSIARSWQSIRSAWPDPRGRGELVHDPAGHARRLLLRPLPEQGEARGSGSAPRARASASSREALEESPAPTGSVVRPDRAVPGEARPPRPRRPRRPPRPAPQAAAIRPVPRSPAPAPSDRAPPGRLRVPTTVVPRSIAIGSTSPPVVSVWSPMRLTRPGANVAISVTWARSPSLDRLVKQGEDGRHAHRTAERRRHRAFYETFGSPTGSRCCSSWAWAQGHVWDDEMLLAFVDAASSPSGSTTATGLSTKPEGIDAGAVAAGILSAFGGHRGGAVRPRRHGGRRGQPARPPRHRVRARRRGGDGRHDRPADGHRPPRRAVGHVDHVDHRGPDVGQPDPAAARSCSNPAHDP